MTKTPPIIGTTSLGRRFLSGASWALSGKIISAGATLLGNALLARLLSPADLGSYFLVFSIVSTVSILCMWGLDRGLVKLIASELATEHPEAARGGIIAAFLLVISVSTLTVLLLASPAGGWVFTTIFDSTLLASMSLMIGLWIAIKAGQGLVSESFRGFHNIRLATVFGGLVTAVLSMLLYLALWAYQGTTTLEHVVQLTMLAAGISLLAGLLLLYRRIRTLEGSGRLPLAKTVRFGFPLMVTSVALFGMRELHLWLLAVFQPTEEIALYGSALRLVTLLVMPLTIVNAVIPPMVADLYSRQQFDRLQGVLQKTATLISVPAFAVFGLIFIFGDDALALVYGEPYRMAFVPLVILSAGQLINVMTGSPGILLTMSGHERVVMSSALGAGLLGIVVSVFGAQALGATGTAAGYATGLILVNLSMWVYAHRRLSIRTHGSLTILLRMLGKIRARIETDGTNGGPLSKFDKIARKLENTIWRSCGYEIIECFGDSRASIFRGLNRKKWIGNLRFRTVAVRGATAYGVGNPNSKTNALKIFQQRLKTIPKDRIIAFMMGEVDVGFLAWLRAKNNNTDPVICMEEALARYTTFLASVKQTHPRLVVFSVPLPTIGDGEPHGDVANARHEVTATQLERTMLTMEFNRRLKAWAIGSGVDFIDLDPYALDNQTMLVRRELLNRNAADHHYDADAFHSLLKVVIDKLHK